MSLKTSSDYLTYLPSPYTSPSCFFYYSNSSLPYSSSPLSNNSFSISHEPIQPQQTVASKMYRKKHRHHSRRPVKQLVNPTEYISTSPDDYKRNNIHRLYSTRSERHQQFIKQHSLQKSPLIFQRSSTIDESEESEPFSSIDNYCRTLTHQSKSISSEDLIDILDKVTSILKSLDNQNQQSPQLMILNDILDALAYIRPTILLPAVKHPLFSILQMSFIYVLRQWHRLSFLSENEFDLFRSMTKLVLRLIKATNNIRLIPSWLSDSSLLEAIAGCLTHIATASELFDQHNKSLFRYFTRLIDAYILYQQRLNDQNHPHKDLLTLLLQPIIECLSSSHFIHSLSDISQDATTSMTTIQKFFLRKCPAFLTSYNGMCSLSTYQLLMILFYL